MTEQELQDYVASAELFLHSKAAEDIEQTQENLDIIGRELPALGITKISEQSFHAAAYSARSRGLLTLKPQPVPVVVAPLIVEPVVPERKPYTGSDSDILRLERSGYKPYTRTSVAEMKAESDKRSREFQAQKEARRAADAHVAKVKLQDAAETVQIFRNNGTLDHEATATARKEARSKR